MTDATLTIPAETAREDLAANWRGSAPPAGRDALHRPFLFVQPFGLADLGGGARIMRSLLTDAPYRCISAVTTVRRPKPTSDLEQIHVPTRPNFGPFERGRLQPWLNAPTRLWNVYHRQSLASVVRRLSPAALHLVVQPGGHSPSIQHAVRTTGTPLAVSFHDHPDFFLEKGQYSPADYELLGQFWREARVRFVISPELGARLCRDFGAAEFVQVTDGVERFGAVMPAQAKQDFTLYFMGLFHRFYEENFRSLFAALGELVAATGTRWTVKLRTDWTPKWQIPNGVTVEKLPPGDDEVVATDMEQADWLYLPLPFGEAGRSFVAYSLSTKMISYLASGRPILYHGPATAAAGNLLTAHSAAICATSSDSKSLDSQLRRMATHSEETKNVAAAAVQLAKERFRIRDIRDRFWTSLASLERVPRAT